MTRTLLLGVGVAAALGACGDERDLREWRPEDHAPPRSRETGQVAAGGQDLSIQVLYSRLCMQCHGSDGRGSQMPGLRSPDLTASRKTDAEMVETILRGRGRMPAFGEQVTESDAQELVRLIRSF